MPQVSVFKLKLTLKWDLRAHSLHKLTVTVKKLILLYKSKETKMKKADFI